MPKPFIANDSFAKKARDSGLLARSAFKLQELNNRFDVIRQGDKVLDLGAAPGSWLQITSQLIGASGLAIGIDKADIKFRAPNIKIIQDDIFAPDLIEQLSAFGLFDVILSDLAPATSGIKIRDQAQSLELAERALYIAEQILARRGHLLIKIFQSPDMLYFIKKLKRMFKTVHVFKPQASRDRSFETYIIAMNKN